MYNDVSLAVQSYSVQHHHSGHSLHDCSSVVILTMNITLYRGFPVSNKFTSSPFVSKLELRLRQGDDEGSAEKSPTAQVLGESTLITQELVREGVLEDINAHLSLVKKAQDLALWGMLEDRLYWFHVRPQAPAC